MGTITGLLGALPVMIPHAGGMVTIPFRRFLPIAFAIAAVGSLTSPFSEFDATGTLVLARFERIHACLAIPTAALVAGTADAIAQTDLVHGIGTLRSVLIWSGLAIISGRVWGWAQSWIVPAMTILPLETFGYSASGVPTRFDWPSQSGTDSLTWAGAAAILFLAATVWAYTPWRLHRQRKAVAAIIRIRGRGRRIHRRSTGEGALRG